MNANLHVSRIKYLLRKLTIWLPAKNKSTRSLNSNIQVFSGGHATRPSPDCLSTVFSTGSKDLTLEGQGHTSTGSKDLTLEGQGHTSTGSKNLTLEGQGHISTESKNITLKGQGHIITNSDMVILVLKGQLSSLR